MSDIRTLSLLNDALSDELAWRRKELYAIKSHVHSVRGTLKRDAFIRSGVAILYAHWEGFVKQAAQYYVEFVSRQRLKHSDLSEVFLVFAAKRVFSEAATSSKTALHLRVTEFFLHHQSEQSEINWKKCVNTKSNLSSVVLKEIITSLGLDYTPYETKEKLLNERLVEARNSIAHGEYLVVDYDSYDDLFNEVLDLMVLLSNQIQNAALTGSFKRVSSLTTSS